jgi:hypothetical protein
MKENNGVLQTRDVGVWLLNAANEICRCAAFKHGKMAMRWPPPCAANRKEATADTITDGWAPLGGN